MYLSEAMYSYTLTSSCHLYHIHALFRAPEQDVVSAVELTGSLHVFFLLLQLHLQLNDLSNIHASKRLKKLVL